MDGRARPMVFLTTDQGCFICITHKTNADGYLRKRWAGVAEMFHRFIYRAHKGPIPEGHEVDHTNRTRYAARKEAARALWSKQNLPGVSLALLFGVTFGAACGWIREWKKQEASLECH